MTGPVLVYGEFCRKYWYHLQRIFVRKSREKNEVPILCGSSCCINEPFECHHKGRRRAERRTKLETGGGKMSERSNKAAPERNRGRGESRMDVEGRVGDGILVFDGMHRYDTRVIVRITKSHCYFRSDRHGDVRWCSIRFVQVLGRTGVYV